MASKNIIQVSEFEKLYYNDAKPFKYKHWQSLCRYLDEQNKAEKKRIEYFRILNKGIQFTNFVGVIQADNLTIEILPKVDKRATTAANETIAELQKQDGAVSTDKAQWQKVLLQMLKECRLLKVHQVDFANLRLKSNSILDIYIELFLSEAESLIHRGLIKRYKKKEGNRTALKGQLLFQKQLAYNIVHRERFFVRYNEYSYDNIYNQIISKTLKLILLIDRCNAFSDRVGRLLVDFPEMSYCVVNKETYSKIEFDRKSEPYREALLISKMLLLNFRPDIAGGHENVMAILFDMNKLWEEFVFRRLKKEEEAFRITVSRQSSVSFWLKDKATSSKTVRPDIVINYTDANNQGKNLIIDTKWKTNDDMNPSDEDLKQMFVYNMFWKCEKSILLYPSTNHALSSGQYHSHIERKSMDSSCGIMAITVLDKESGLLTSCLGKDILQIVLSEGNE